MTRVQIQVGCYRLEILVSVAGVGGETRPVTSTGNEGARYRFSDPMPQTDFPLKRNVVSQLRGHKPRPDTVRRRAVIVRKRERWGLYILYNLVCMKFRCQRRTYSE